MADTHYQQPPEWAAHERCWIAWPRPQTWGEGWQNAQRAYAAVANQISEFEAVSLLIEPAQLPSARRLLSSQIECLGLPYDDAWLRDTAAVIAHDTEQRPHAISWNFNGWGNQFTPWDRDRALSSHMATHLELPLLTADIVAEGGAMHVDGNGLLVTTRQCLQNPNRNPGMSVEAIEAELFRLTGASHVIWLPEGIEDDHTNGHVDELACFTAPGRLLMVSTDDGTDHNYSVVRQAREAVRAFHEDTGIVVDITAIPQPEARYQSGQRLSLSYINFYLANDAVILPAFDQKSRDANAKAIIQEQYPERKVMQLPALDITVGGGGIHCITQQQPLIQPTG